MTSAQGRQTEDRQLGCPAPGEAHLLSVADSKSPKLKAPTPPLNSASAIEGILENSHTNIARMAKTQLTDRRRIRLSGHSRKSIGR